MKKEFCFELISQPYTNFCHRIHRQHPGSRPVFFDIYSKLQFKNDTIISSLKCLKSSY